MRNPNFLVMDEPTNDLDIMTLQVLEAYLKDYGGCLIVVSHDRYFMDKVVDHLLVFEGEGRIKDFPSGYSDYLQWKRGKAEQEAAQAAATARESTKSAESPKPTRPASPTKRKLSFNEKRELEQLDRQIPEMEAEKAALETEMSSGTLPIDELTAKSLRVAELIKRIDEASMRWLELSDIGS